MFGRSQLALISFFTILFLILYFGLSTKPSKQVLLEKSRQLSFESTDVRILLADAKKSLNTRDNSLIGLRELELQQADDDTLRLEAFKTLSSEWYKIGHPAISGYYAEQVAELSTTAQAWSVAGTTFAICIKQSNMDKVKNYCLKHAVDALENAISIEPDNIDHRVNMALVYTDAPPADNPMKGIQMLIGLNSENPDNVTVLNQLGRLAIQTNQWDRAKERLERSLELDSDNLTTICMIAKVYQSLQQIELAEKYSSICNKN